MYKHKTPQITVSWEIRDGSFSFTHAEGCQSLFVCDAQDPSLGSSLRLCYSLAFVSQGSLHLWAITSMLSGLLLWKQTWLCKSIWQGRGAGHGRREGNSFTYNFLLSHLLYLHLLPRSVSNLFKLCLITSMHFPTYLPIQHFLKTIASPRKYNKTLQKEEAIVVWAG